MSPFQVLSAEGIRLWWLLVREAGKRHALSPLSRDALVTALVASHEVEEALCRQETGTFLAEALATSMLLETEAP